MMLLHQQSRNNLQNDIEIFDSPFSSPRSNVLEKDLTIYDKNDDSFYK